MHGDPLLLDLTIASLVLLALGLVMRIVRQPHVVGYLLAGMILGPDGISLVSDPETLRHIGEFGVMILLFFVGMKVSPRQLVENRRVAVIGTLFQIGASVGAAALVGSWLGWDLNRILLIGFVISLSSTAVVLTYLQERDELDTPVGRDVVSVLLAQDIAIVPMLVIISMLGGGLNDPGLLIRQGVGIVLIAVLLWLLVRSKRLRLPLGARLRADHEMQVFAALVICLGMAWLFSQFGLSGALGAFFAGMLIGVARETSWVQGRLEPFRVVFVAAFFVSVGTLVRLDFLLEFWVLLLSLLGLVLVTNWLINVFVFRLLGEPWGRSVYAGALLSQVGEFSFLLAAFGLQVGVMNEFGHQLAVSIIALSLLLAPTWIFLAQLLNASARGQKRGKPSWIC